MSMLSAILEYLDQQWSLVMDFCRSMSPSLKPICFPLIKEAVLFFLETHSRKACLRYFYPPWSAWTCRNAHMRTRSGARLSFHLKLVVPRNLDLVVELVYIVALLLWQEDIDQNPYCGDDFTSSTSLMMLISSKPSKTVAVARECPGAGATMLKAETLPKLKPRTLRNWKKEGSV